LINYFEDTEWERFMTMYKIIDVIGSGGYGVVLAALDKVQKKKVALKIVFKKDSRGESLRREYEILKDIKHPNIVKIYSKIDFSNFLIISIKLAEESLDVFRDRRLEEKKPLTDNEVSQIAKGMLRGIMYIHDEKNLIHCDIKPQNVIVTDGVNLSKCQLIDFGLAIKNNSNSREGSFNLGTYSFQPPEQMKKEYNYGKKSDIWAVGITIYTLLFRNHPIINRNDECKFLDTDE